MESLVSGTVVCVCRADSGPALRAFDSTERTWPGVSLVAQTLISWEGCDQQSDRIGTPLPRDISLRLTTVAIRSPRRWSAVVERSGRRPCAYHRVVAAYHCTEILCVFRHTSPQLN